MSKEAADSLKALADLWASQGKALLDAQQGAARTMIDGLQTIFGDGLEQSGSDQAQADLQRLWSTATQLSTELAGRLGQASSPAASDILERITNPRHWIVASSGFDEAVGRVANGPLLADMGGVERRYARVVQCAGALRQRSLEHQRVVLEAWMEAGRQYLAEAAGRTLDTRQALALWTEIGNRHMLEVQRSEPFLTSQRDMIRASSELRVAQSELGDHIAMHFGLPTRSELDDVHRSATEMRRELRRLRREMAALSVDGAAVVRTKRSRPSVSRPTPARRESR